MLKVTKKNSLNISAFSIVEAMVGMVITAIIMGLIFVIFSMVSERLLDYKNQNRLINDMNRLTYSINKDIFENEKMLVTENGLLFKGYSGEAVLYRSQEEYLLRSTEVFTDTFRVQLKQVRADSLQSNSKKKMFQKIKLNVVINESVLDLNFYKPIYANELIQEINK